MGEFHKKSLDLGMKYIHYKILFFIFLSISLNSYAQTYDAMNIEMLGHWDKSNSSTGTGVGNRYASCYGYEQNGRYYAILGAADKTYFIDITDPSNPIAVDSLNGGVAHSIWREYKVYQHYAYLVSDDGGPNKFQIVDLQYLPDSIHVIHNGNTYFSRAHTIYIDSIFLYCGSNTYVGDFSEMTIWDISNPVSPVKLRELRDDFPGLVGHVHDMYVQHDTIYASCGYDKLYVFKYHSDANYLELIGSKSTYTDAGYNHSSVLMDDHKTLIVADEVPEKLRMKAFDISDMTDIQEVSVFQSQYGATAHNPYNAHINNRLYVAAYHDGLNIYDCSDPSQITLTGYFDTHYQSVGNNTSATGAYNGNWGAYKFPSNHWIIASDMQNGLYILYANVALGLSTDVNEIQNNSLLLQTYPNPTHDQMMVSFENPNSEAQAEFTITDSRGVLVSQEIKSISKGINRVAISTKTLTAGTYFISVKNSTNKYSSFFIKE